MGIYSRRVIAYYLFHPSDYHSSYSINLKSDFDFDAQHAGFGAAGVRADATAPTGRGPADGRVIRTHAPTIQAVGNCYINLRHLFPE
jgi:hypothetical protein